MINKTVLFAAFSGGADSTAMLLMLRSAAPKIGFTLKAIHINHNLRGDESFRDEKFCLSLCEKLGIEIFVRQVNVTEFAQTEKIGIEEAARILRYKAFGEIVKADNPNGTNLVATAHNADDNAETVLFNLFRGSGLRGLCGIPKIREEDGFTVVRPILGITRDEILSFLKSRGQDYITDSSNADINYTRNKIRLEIMPLIKSINPSFCEKLFTTCEILKNEDTALDAIVGLCPDLNNIPVELKGRYVKNFFEENGIEPDFKKIKLISESTGEKFKIEVKPGLFVIKENGKLLTENDLKIFDEPPLKISFDKEYKFCDKLITISLLSREKFNKFLSVNKNLTNFAFNCDIIKSEIFIRTKSDGDKFRRVNRNFDSRLKKLYNEFLKPAERGNNIIVSSDEGILFVENFGAADFVKITGETENIAVVTIKEAKD
ncbi:MAG: tRNA lysidine(34) synthetase TilS [Ruminococcus sp.]|jgi:tRNA(Ile)-lysidine synthase|nr:tRNA lysidine(34) synthetase TilS [Ruminococcus sp.]